MAKQIVEEIVNNREGPPPIPNYKPGPPPDRSHDRSKQVVQATVVVSEPELEGGGEEESPKLQGAMVQPCGLATQSGLLPDGSRKLKKRLTHKLSYSLTRPGTPVNSRIDMDKYPEMVYRWCLSRIIHFIIALRMENPGREILIAKFDCSDAYRRVSHAAFAVVQLVLVWAGVAYIALQLAFGGSPNPACLCAFSLTLIHPALATRLMISPAPQSFPNT